MRIHGVAMRIHGGTGVSAAGIAGITGIIGIHGVSAELCCSVLEQLCSYRSGRKRAQTHCYHAFPQEDHATHTLPNPILHGCFLVRFALGSS